MDKLVPSLVNATFIVLFGLFSQKAFSKDYQFYYVSVGNEHYESFNEQTGLGLSARVVSEYFEQFGAVSGITLRSKSNQLLSKSDILSAINDVTLRMNDDKDNVFIFYYAGHCLGEPLTGQQWLIPGNLQIDVNKLLRSKLDTDVFDAAMLSPIALHAAMQNSLASQSLLLMDCCYSAGDQAYKNVASQLTRVLGARQARFLKDIRSVNLSDDAWSTSVFATVPGKSTYAVSAPNFMKPRIVLPIGPLARRIGLSLHSKVTSRDELTYLEFVNSLKDLHLDNVTKPASSVNRDIYIDGTLFSYTQPLGSVRLNQSFSKSSSLATLSLEELTTEEIIVVSEATEKSSISIVSENGDWVGGGKATNISIDDYQIFVAQDSSQLVIYAEGVLRNNYWNFEFSNSFNDEIEISSSGRGCSESSGSVDLSAFDTNEEGAVTRIKLNFTHFCDGNSAGLNGVIDLHLAPLFSYL